MFLNVEIEGGSCHGVKTSRYLGTAYSTVAVVLKVSVEQGKYNDLLLVLY